MADLQWPHQPALTISNSDEEELWNPSRRRYTLGIVLSRTRINSETPKAIISFVFMVLLLYYKIRYIVFVTNALAFSILANSLNPEAILVLSAVVCGVDLLIPIPKD